MSIKKEKNMNGVNFASVNIKGGFWYEKQKMNENVTINAVYDRFYDTGRVEAFACKWKEGEGSTVRPHFFWDSDVAKWIEGASYIMQKQDRPDLEEKIEHIIDMIEENQWEDGYVNSYFTVIKEETRFTNRDRHELYCCGHLIEAAIAYYNATGKDRFLKIMLRYVDLVDRLFHIENSAGFETPGHEEIELALFRLYGLTKDEKHLTLAKHFLDRRGNSEKDGNDGNLDRRYNIAGEYSQSHKPVREQREAVGHSVRAHYLYTAMADHARVTGEPEMLEACRALFEDIVNKKMYITGSSGSSHLGEAYTKPYDLPNETAYAETCAAISLLYFADRMLKTELDGKYADIVERALYNGVLSGVSLSGKAFFYENPLEINLRNHGRHGRNLFEAERKFDRLPITQRVEVFGCSCCPPNINRLLSSIGDYLYSAEGGTIAVNQFAESDASMGNMKISQTTNYPFDGRVEIKTEGVKTLKIRIPGWCGKYTVSADHRIEKGYAVIENPASTVCVEFDMPARLVYANAEAFCNAGRAAVCRGPIVYCAEAQDNGTNNLNALVLDSALDAKVIADSFTGLPELEVTGKMTVTGDALYSSEPPKYEPRRIRLIPFNSFANRGSDSMLVWFRV